MDDAIDLVAPPRDTEAGVRTRDTASVGVERDVDLVPLNPSDADNPGIVGESLLGYALVGEE